MPTPEQPYDAIAAAYKESKQLPFRTAVEAHTLSRLHGNLEGRRVLDLACGEGFYTRKLRQHGAAEVVGVDISREMILLAEAEERRAPIGVRYLHGDAGALDLQESSDLVVAAYLLNYARTRGELLRFCQVAYRALKAGGRFVGFNDNVNRNPNEAPSFAPYGFEKSCPHPPREGDEIIYAIRQPDGGVFRITNFYLSPESYERAFAEAGFRNFTWSGPWLEPGQTANPFWNDFMRHAPLIGFSADRP
jgi:SAM-dependent methyltransferase